MASSFRRAAQAARELAAEVRAVNDRLLSDWEGRSRQSFEAENSHISGGLSVLSEILDHNASSISAMDITIYEKVYLNAGGYIAE